jgi:hypothetical protein
MAYNFQTGNNKNCLQNTKVLFGNAVFAALMSGIKHDVIPQNGDCSRESNFSPLVFPWKP